MLRTSLGVCETKKTTTIQKSIAAMVESRRWCREILLWMLFDLQVLVTKVIFAMTYLMTMRYMRLLRTTRRTMGTKVITKKFPHYRFVQIKSIRLRSDTYHNIEQRVEWMPANIRWPYNVHGGLQNNWKHESNDFIIWRLSIWTLIDFQSKYDWRSKLIFLNLIYSRSYATCGISKIFTSLRELERSLNCMNNFCIARELHFL